MLDAWEKEELDDFSTRLAANSHIPENIAESSLSSTDSDRPEGNLSSNSSARFIDGGRFSPSGSMATRNTPPSLDTRSTSSSSFTSSDNNPVVISSSWVLEDDEDGALTARPDLPPRPRYQCLFHVLDCDQSFENKEQWKVHVLSHFRSHPLPKDARCPFCQGTVSDAQRDIAWEIMLDHVAETHFQHGEQLSGSLSDIELMRYLFNLKVITLEQFKMVQLTSPWWSPGYHRSQNLVETDVGCASDPVCVSANPRRERRMRGARNK